MQPHPWGTGLAWLFWLKGASLAVRPFFFLLFKSRCRLACRIAMRQTLISFRLPLERLSRLRISLLPVFSRSFQAIVHGGYSPPGLLAARVSGLRLDIVRVRSQ